MSNSFIINPLVMILTYLVLWILVMFSIWLIIRWLKKK